MLKILLIIHVDSFKSNKLDYVNRKKMVGN